jgi:hypothetical protein
MAKVTAAAAAADFGAHHPITEIRQFLNMRLLDGSKKARPAGARIKLSRRRKQRQPATGADISTLLMVVVVLAGERPLCTLLPQHRILLRSQQLFPFGFTFLDALRTG